MPRNRTAIAESELTDPTKQPINLDLEEHNQVSTRERRKTTQANHQVTNMTNEQRTTEHIDTNNKQAKTSQRQQTYNKHKQQYKATL